MSQWIEDSEKVDRLIAEGYSAYTIARKTGITEYRIRCHIDPSYGRKCYEKKQEKVHSVALTIDNFNPLYDPRRDGDLEWRSASDYLTGVPPVGRSALENRR